MAHSKLRIKLYFSDDSPLFWTQVDLNKIKTVQELSEEIVKKHQSRIKVRSKSIQLMLDDAILPNEESITILGAQSFTSLMSGLRQDINRVSSLSRWHNGTFP